MTFAVQVTVVVAPDDVQEWTITVDTLAAHHSYRLTLDAPDGRRWSAEWSDVFGCLLEVRRQVEPLGVQLCCNGCRRNAWSSGMQRDMGQGLSVHLLSHPCTGERPPDVSTLGWAPPEEVVSVEEQCAWFESFRTMALRED